MRGGHYLMDVCQMFMMYGMSATRTAHDLEQVQASLL